MNIRYKHPYKSFDDQIKLLEERGIEIGDYDFAKNALMTFPYYSIINGYKDMFLRAKEPDIYKKGTTFKMLYQVHWIDIQTSNIIFKYSLAVEERLKALVSNFVAATYSIEEASYLKETNYSRARSQRGKLSDVIEAIEEAKQTSQIAQHYIKKENNLPPWIAAEVISFGSMMNWYSILQQNLKKQVVNVFLGRLKPKGLVKTDDKFQFCKICLEQVYRFRNLSAHGNRTFKLNFEEKYTQKFRFLEEFSLDYLYKTNTNNVLARNSLFSVLVSIIVLLDDEYLISSMLDELRNIFAIYGTKPVFNGNSIYDLFEVDVDFITRLTKFMNEKFESDS